MTGEAITGSRSIGQRYLPPSHLPPHPHPPSPSLDCYSAVIWFRVLLPVISLRRICVAQRHEWLYNHCRMKIPESLLVIPLPLVWHKAHALISPFQLKHMGLPHSSRNSDHSLIKLLVEWWVLGWWCEFMIYYMAHARYNASSDVEPFTDLSRLQSVCLDHKGLCQVQNWLQSTVLHEMLDITTDIFEVVAMSLYHIIV